MSFQRTHKDRRARKRVIALALLIILPLLCAAYLVWVLRMSLFATPLVLGAAVSAWQGYSRYREKVKTRSEANPGPQLSPLQQAEFRTYFMDLALIYAVILDRAGSERFLKTKTLPEGFEVTTRRVHLDLLKSRGAWDKMTPHDRNALITPDGEWNPAWIDNVIPAYEALRLMRWILRIDEFLPVIGKQLKFDWRSAHEIVTDPAKLLQPAKLVHLKSIETARAAAEQFYVRCIAEMIYRGDLQAKSEEAPKWAADLASKLKDKQSEDLVLGVKLVSEVSSEELRWAATLAQRRLRFLQGTLQLMEKGVPPEPPYAFNP